MLYIVERCLTWLAIAGSRFGRSCTECFSGHSKHETFTNVGLMLVQRRRRWPSIKPALDRCFDVRVEIPSDVSWQCAILHLIARIPGRMRLKPPTGHSVKIDVIRRYRVYIALQSQNAVSAHLKSKQILPFDFAMYM